MKVIKPKGAEDAAMCIEKRRIHQEIDAYRKTRGVGCFKDISEATGGKVAVHTISHMYMGTRVSFEVWLQVGEALEKLRK